MCESLKYVRRISVISVINSTRKIIKIEREKKEYLIDLLTLHNNQNGSHNVTNQINSGPDSARDEKYTAIAGVIAILAADRK